jgi:GNAT superfamily N-acetyltransferase
MEDRMVRYIEDKKEKEFIASSILADLPEWFGLPESTAEYIRCSQDYPFWADMEDGKTAGFIVLKETSSATAEIYVMGVLKSMHNQGIGKSLFDALYTYAKEHGYSFLQVKTVEKGRYMEYDMTIKFYKKMGFQEFESLSDIYYDCMICVLLVVAKPFYQRLATYFYFHH